jgi:hypothetical protein
MRSPFALFLLLVVLIACAQPDGASDDKTLDSTAHKLIVDSDADGVPDGSDNCPSIANPTQANSNGVGPGDACELSLVLSPGLLNQYARFQSHKELVIAFAPLSFSAGPDLLRIDARAQIAAFPHWSLLTKKLGVLSIGELLPGHIDTISGNEVLIIKIGSASVLGGAKASEAWLRLNGSASVSVAFFKGAAAQGTQTFTTSGTSLRRVAPPSGVFDRLEIRATSGRVALVGPNEALMLALAGAQLPCPSGYERVGEACIDIDECAGLNHACDSLTTCTNTPGSFSCGACPQGYRGTGATSCVDVDECSEGSANCSPLVACSNTPGSYRCGECPAGYRGDGHVCTDVDECAEHLDQCDPLVSCTNLVGSYECGACPAGYVGGGSTGCADIDECSGPNRACDPLANCTNLPGGYECGACPDGYRGDGRSCADIDECADGSALCSPLVACGNTVGGYQCGACPSGYEGDGRTCFDIDECAVAPGPCAPSVTCTNTAGAFQCGSCPIGYRGDGRSCVDIDECETAPCAPEVSCLNTNGGFSCGPCPSGFTGDGYTGCVDIDECAQELHDCSPLVTCGNTLGSYRCDDCPQGYAGDGHTCVDVDECESETSLCDAHVACTNTEGGYTCGECPTGYTGDGFICQDIDECSVSPCDPLTWCANEEGSYTCGECPPGYEGDGYAGCLDIDECATENGGCTEDEECFNEEGSYYCEVACLLDDRTCDGRDDDCDGDVDDDYEIQPVVCGGPLCNGRLECIDGVVVAHCNLEEIDANEQCNGVDDDCDGAIDEDLHDRVDTCGIGACNVPGHFTCVDGQPGSDCPPPAPNDASCNGIDDDCDFRVDEDYPFTQITCGTGACLASGTHFCDRGTLVSRCTPRAPALNDVTCNGIDDDCNGTADEDFVSQLTQCGVGACRAQGTTSCISGLIVNSCQPSPAAADDSACNGVDDDCNGSVDEDFVSQATSCGTANCASSGTTSCVAGQIVDSCRPATTGPSDANCNGVDDDCDGNVDDDFAEQLVLCQSAGCSGAGAIVCSGGAVTNTCETAPGCTRETSCQDGQDNDGDGSADCRDEDCGYLPACFEDCNNGRDDNGDGVVDCLDDRCSAVAPCVAEICGNGLDDDGDDRPDCFDSACSGAAGCPALPPDLATIAPAPPTAPEPSLLDFVSFLLEGADPIQHDVSAAFDHERTALLTLSTLDRHGAPLAGVKVSAEDHPEYGFVYTRADGVANLVVSGGEQLTIAFTGRGLLPVHRKVYVRWNAYAALDPVVMTPLDATSTEVTFSGVEPMQVARGGINEDARGQRQATLLIPAGTTAQMVLADGSAQPLSGGTLRLTEYTVGPTGPAAMPAYLPPNTGYTYAVEGSIDQAVAAGAKRVEFSQDVMVYLDNFLSAPDGLGIPLGYYDFDCGCWVPDRDARIVRIVSITNGAADLDVTGDGVADTGAALTALGIASSELRSLAELYAPGKSLWRMRVQHFTPWDCNLFSIARDEDPRRPRTPEISPLDALAMEENQCHQSGSILSCSTRDLGESLPIAGTPYSLTYSSAALRAYRTSIDIPLTDSVLPPDLLNATIYIGIAGQWRTVRLQPEPSLSYHFEWDGRDLAGRRIPSHLAVDVAIVPCLEYRSPGLAAPQGDRAWSFGAVPAANAQPVPLTSEIFRDSQGGQVCNRYSVIMRNPLSPESTTGQSSPWRIDAVPTADNPSSALNSNGLEVDKASAGVWL